jgi:hypothetical protein
MSQNRAETTCSACGRFIGSWERCPFCRHFNPKRPIVRALKYSTPFLAVLGIVGLAFLGKSYGTPAVKIGSLGRKSNFAQVRIEGRVSADIRFYSADAQGRPSSLEFEVDDGTGLIRVRCYEDAYEEMLAAAKIPAFGDQASLIGNYQYKAKRQFVILSSPEDLRINREMPERATPIRKAINAGWEGLAEGTRLKLTGRVRSRVPGTYDIVWSLEDPKGGRFPVSLSRDVMDACGMSETEGVAAQMNAGAFVTCFGALERSRDRDSESWQLAPAGPGDLRMADEATWKADNGGN